MMEQVSSKDIPRDPNSKEYAEFRDRAAYVYVTGTFPTHLRQQFTAMLKAITMYHQTPVSLDGQFGHSKVDGEVVEILRLEEHPMVRKVRASLSRGWRIHKPEDVKGRRSYRKVPMVNPDTGEKIAVQCDGSVLDV